MLRPFQKAQSTRLDQSLTAKPHLRYDELFARVRKFLAMVRTLPAHHHLPLAP
jgi:hypothetical protein